MNKSDKWFELYETKQKNHIIVEHYKPIVDLKIKAIDIETREVAWKKIVDFSIHKNLEMYKVYSKFDEFKPFWVSTDHSLIALDITLDQLVKISPVAILSINEPNRFYLVKEINNTLSYLPIDFDLINIEKDESVTEAFDFTVEDYYTFATDDGIFVQDTMAVYNVPYHKDLAKLNISKNLINPGSLKPLPTFEHEFVLALYQMTVKEPDIDNAEDYDPNKKYDWNDTIRINGNVTTYGRYFLSTRTGQNINYPLTSSKVRSLVTKIIWTYKYDKILEILKFLTEQVKNAKSTLSLEDFEYIRSRIAHIEEDDPIKFINELNKRTEQLKQIAPEHIKNVVESGARGAWEQVRQMTIAKGAISDTNNSIIGVIKHSLMEGLSEDELFISTYGTRKGLIDKGLETSVTGYAARQLVYALAKTKHNPDNIYCGTEKCLPIQLTKNNIKMFLYRYIRNPQNPAKPLLISHANKDKFIGKKVLMYSPMFCTGEEICKVCFGSLYKLIKSRYIGIIAAQTISERTTQLTLRTFHTSGSVENISESGSNVDITTYMDQFKHILTNRKMALLDTYKGFQSIFEQYNILSIWLEILCRQLYIDKKTLKPAAMSGYNNPFTRLSLKETISTISWFHGLAFENAIKHLKLGLFNDFKVENPSLFEELMLL